MEFRLRVFVEVAGHLSFTKAANVLGISQPAISKHIQELEATFKVKLFERSSGRIMLTAAGQMLLYHARGILHKYGELSQDMELVVALGGADGLEGMADELRVAATASSLQNQVTPLFEKFSAIYPNVKLLLTVASAKEVEELLKEGKVDLGFVDDQKSKESCSQ